MAYSANQRLEPKVYTLWHNKLWLAVTAHADVSDIEASESNRVGFSFIWNDVNSHAEKIPEALARDIKTMK